MRRQNYLAVFWTFLLLLCLQTPVAALDNPNKSYFVFSPDGKYLAKLFQTSRKTWVKVQETDGMQTIAQWQIPSFQPHTVQFSPHDSTRFLLADSKQFLIYELKTEKPEILMAHPEMPGQEIVGASFDVEKDHLVWATQNKVFRTNLEHRQDRRIASTEKEKGDIRSVVPLANSRVAVVVKGSNKIHLFSSENPLFSEELSGHRLPVVGLQSPLGQVLFSLDDARNLLIWDINRLKIIRSLQLGSAGDVSQVKGVSLDEPRKHLLVQTYADPSGIGQRYAIADLLKGYVDPDKQSVLATASGNIYFTSDLAAGKPDSRETLKKLEKRRSIPFKPRRKNSFYDLAKIEADNENYEAALDFIRRIPLDDSQYKQSRELQKRIRNQMEIKGEFDAALQQYRRGNLESAKILLENILARSPENAKAKRYLSLTESKLTKGVWLKILLAMMILLLMGLLGYLVWKYRETIGKKAGAAKKGSGEGAGKKSIVNDRREFIIRLDETKKMLKKAVALDRAGRYKDKWLEFSGSLTSIEKKAKVKDKFLADLSDQLTKIQQKILRFSPGSKLPKRKTKPEPEKNGEGKQRAAAQKTQPEKQQAIDEGPKKKTKPDYYQVLGVDKKATADQIKKAYHKKMQEYHPDKHNASDFKWVKEEAARMTSEIQEAYRILSDPRKKKEYQS